MVVERNVLNDYIHHYEALTYDVRSLHHSHGRVRRSLDSSVRLDFHAHGRSVALLDVFAAVMFLGYLTSLLRELFVLCQEWHVISEKKLIPTVHVVLSRKM